MIVTTVKNHKLVIVGQHFFWRNNFHQRILLNVFSNAEELEALFLQNCQAQEDFVSLARHEDPVVRKLVAMNLEQLDILVNDSDPTVAHVAQQYAGILATGGSIVI